MAEVTGLVCDVYGVMDSVRKYEVKLCEIGEKGVVYSPDITQRIDLCPKALDRLTVLISRGISPVVTRKRKSKGETDEAAR